jgi:hypothetical protein
MWTNARARARRVGVPFNLELSDIHIPTHCPVLGIPLSPKRTGVQGGADHSPSLDRIRPDRGYVRGNVVVISSKANSIKSNATADEIATVARWLASLDK